MTIRLGTSSIRPNILHFEHFSVNVVYIVSDYLSYCYEINVFRLQCDFLMMCRRTSFLIIVFTQYLRNVKVPIFCMTRQKKCSKRSYPVFSLFPVSVYMSYMCTICRLAIHFKSSWTFDKWTSQYRQHLKSRPTLCVGVKFRKEVMFLPREWWLFYSNLYSAESQSESEALWASLRVMWRYESFSNSHRSVVLLSVISVHTI